jgi:RNA polymerase sigma-70 factor (ECF subfamily)
MEFNESLTLSRSGDAAAREQLFGRWRPLLSLQARSLLAQELATQVDPSDVVQETLTQAVRDVDQFRGQTEGEWVSWLQCLLAGHAAKLLRHHSAAKRDIARTGPLSTGLTADGRSPSDVAMDREQALRLATAIAGLDERMRTVVIGRSFEGRSFDEIALLLGCSSGAARVLWTRALRQLRDAWSK